MAVICAQVAIRGIRPLLWHRFGPDSIPLERKSKQGVAGNNPEEWKQTVLRTPKGQLFVEPSYIFGCLRDGARHTRVKNSSLQPKVASTLRIPETPILLDRWLPEGKTPPVQAESEPVYVDVRSVRNPATHGRNIRYRVAACPGWNAKFQLFWDETIISRGQMEAVINDAGSFQGLGDGRSIGMGRFELVSFEITEASSAKKPATKRVVARTKA